MFRSELNPDSRSCSVLKEAPIETQLAAGKRLAVECTTKT